MFLLRLVEIQVLLPQKLLVWPLFCMQNIPIFGLKQLGDS